MQPQPIVDQHGVAVSAVSGVLGFVFNSLPIAVVGVPLAVIVMAFSGVMLALSVLPNPTEDRRTWTLPFFLTVGASALVNMALRREGLDESYQLGMGFLLGMLMASMSVLVGRNWQRIVAAVVERIRGRG